MTAASKLNVIQRYFDKQESVKYIAKLLKSQSQQFIRLLANNSRTVAIEICLNNNKTLTK